MTTLGASTACAEVFDGLQEDVTAPNRHKAIVDQEILLSLSNSLKCVINTCN